MSKKLKFIQWGGKLVYGGALAFALSLLTAERLSGELHEFYRESMLWRNFFGADPNKITSMMEKVSWAFIFICSWWMLWKLDCLLGLESTEKKREANKEALPENQAEDDATKSTNSDKKGKEPSRQKDAEENGETSASVQAKIPSDPAESRFSETLGVKEPYSEEEIKSAYRKLIAQYHPDRVSSMGPEIREVAETKAKEINEAYEYFRKKFEQNQ